MRVTRGLFAARLPTGGLAIVLGIGLVACSGAAAPTPIPVLPLPTTPPIATDMPVLALPQDSDVDAIILGTGEDFQSAVDAAPDGARFVIAPGVHRLQEVTPRDGMTFEGLPGAVLNGSLEIRGWVPDGPNLWRLDGYASTAMDHGTCIEGYEGCRLTQDVYIDDVMLWQVTERDRVVSGTWFWDGTTIFIADDPTSRQIELSTATHAFFGEASDVTIRGLVVEKYAVPAQYGAIQAESLGGGVRGSGWLIEDSEIRLNHGAGVRLGDRTVVRGVSIHHNGQLGIAATGASGAVVEDSAITQNNMAGFDSGWEGGGAKFKETIDLVVRGNHVEGNLGPGLWTDIDNHNTLYESNTVIGNWGPGIFHEISHSAVIRDNTVTDNGQGWADWLWGAGILVAASDDVEVHGNTVSGNADGIAGIQQERGGGPSGQYRLTNLHVHHNTISVDEGHSGIVEDIGERDVFTEWSNSFESNTYVGVVGRRYAWNGRKLGASAWMQTGQDVDGTWRDE